MGDGKYKSAMHNIIYAHDTSLLLSLLSSLLSSLSSLPPFLPLFPPSPCPFLSPLSLLRHIPHNLPNLAGPCNIKRRNSSLSQQEFLEKLVTKVKTTQHSNTFLVFCFLVRFAYTEPVILTGMSDQSVSNHFQVNSELQM